MARKAVLFCVLCTTTLFHVSPSYSQSRPLPGDGQPQQVSVSAAIEWDKRHQVSQSLQPHTNMLLGDSIDPHVGGLSFRHTDVELPGNSNLPVALIRELTQGYAYSYHEDVEFGDWRYITPNLSVVTATGVTSNSVKWIGSRCSNPTDAFKPVRFPLSDSYAFPVEYSNGLILETPESGSEHVLFMSPLVAQPFPSEARYVTPTGWYLTCGPTTEQGESFIATSPSGNKYYFDKYVQRRYVNLGGHINLVVSRTLAMRSVVLKQC